MVNFSHKLNFIFTALLLTLAHANNVYAANIIAHLDRNPVSLDESFHLVLEADSKVDANPDLGVLDKDFDILNTSQSNNMSFVNGAMSQKYTWTLVLMAKQAGVFTIPSIDFGKDKSPSLRVTITSTSSSNNKSSASADKDVFLEVELDQKSTWVQGQLIYSIRIFHNINLNNPTLSQLETSDKDAIIERLGDTQNYEAFMDGIRYAVSELKFAIYPQHSGKIIFKPVLLESRVSTSRSQSLFDQFMGAGKIKRVRSKSLNANIKPRPDDIQLKNWLPAKNVTLKEEWSENIQQLKAGEPVTRTITLTADGQMAAYLPELNLAEINGLKQYPDKPVQTNSATQQSMTASRQIKIAMIPTRAGSYKVPEISIPWWNTRTGKKETAHLPEIILKASGSVANYINPAVGNQMQTPQQATTENDGISMTAPQDSSQDSSLDSSGDKSSIWRWISLILAIGWLITVVAYLRKKGPVILSEKGSKIKTLPIKPLEQTVLKQCQLSNTEQTKNALLAWASARWPDNDTTSLADIARLSPAELHDSIMSLNSALYSASNKDWDGKQLSKSFETYKNQLPKEALSNSSILDPLYKI